MKQQEIRSRCFRDLFLHKQQVRYDTVCPNALMEELLLNDFQSHGARQAPQIPFIHSRKMGLTIFWKQTPVIPVSTSRIFDFRV